MPTAYRGVLQIECNIKECTRDKLKRDVSADCYGCASAVVSVLNLENEVLLTMGPAIEGVIRESEDKLNSAEKRGKQGGKENGI